MQLVFCKVKSEVKSAVRNVRQCVNLCCSAHLDCDYHATDGCLESEKPFITSFDVFMTKMLKHLTAQRLKESESSLQVLVKTSPKALSTHVLIETSINQLKAELAEIHAFIQSVCGETAFEPSAGYKYTEFRNNFSIN